VTILDWGIVAFAVVLGIWGFRQGLIVGALTLVGFGAGVIAGGRLGTLLLAEGSKSPYAPLFAALGALLVGALAAVVVENYALGLRERVVHGRTRHLLDGVGGGALITAVALGLAWTFGAVALHTPGAAQLRMDVQRSLILRNLNSLLPPSGPLLNALNRVDPAPSIPGATMPVAPPDPAIVSDRDVSEAGDSVVRVLGTACGLGVEGSGWVADRGLIVTNAHVIAGEDDTTITTHDGASLAAVPVYFDPVNDLAILHVDANIPALLTASVAERGTPGALLGYPENGPYALSPARLGDTRSVLSVDAPNQQPIRRTIVFLRGSVRSGNSGGPLVNSQGRVLATVFASTTSGQRGGYAIPNRLVERALASVAMEVDTGSCVS
jgi:S1-C subfamily serine protease